MKRAIESFKSIAEISIAVTAFLGLTLGIVELSHQRKIQQKEQVMKLFLKQYEGEQNIIGIRNDLYQDLGINKADKVLKILKNEEKNQDVMINEYENFMREFTIDRAKKLLILTDFYNGIASCVESELCDREAAIPLFQRQGEVFFENYYPFFCHLYDQWEDKVIQEDSVKFYRFDYEQSCSHSDKLASF